MFGRAGPLFALLLTLGGAARAQVDAPRLAAPGPHGVGLASLILPGSDHRSLPADVWYPASPKAGAPGVVYAGALTGESGRDVAFTQAGTAVRGAPADAGTYPLVILAHGYGGTPVAMSWLAENLATKGYVVVGPHFGDPPYTAASRFREALIHRPLDIGLAAAEARALAGKPGPLAHADPARMVLIGYSIGGYGAAEAAGAEPSACLTALTGPAKVQRVESLKAVVLISPMTRVGPCAAWGDQGAAAIRAPTLLIAGDHDRLVGYRPGVETLFERETGAPRYLLTFHGAGHSIGMNAAPSQMRGTLWDQDWFEDPVWRKDRVIAIELHFITAFLDGTVKGEEAHRAFLDVPQPESDEGVWPERPGEPYAAFSPGKPGSTVWPGFQRNHDIGLSLRFAPAAP